MFLKLLFEDFFRLQFLLLQLNLILLLLQPDRISGFGNFFFKLQDFHIFQFCWIFIWVWRRLKPIYLVWIYYSNWFFTALIFYFGVLHLCILDGAIGFRRKIFLIFNIFIFNSKLVEILNFKWSLWFFCLFFRWHLNLILRNFKDSAFFF